VTTVAIVHDYLTQRGGAERVVLSMLKAFPEAELHTSIYNPETTFDAFRDVRVHTTVLDRVTPFRRHHRVALPLYPVVFERLRIDADVLIASSSGWAHGARTSGRKIVYCYNSARWLYQPAEYLSEDGLVVRGAMVLLRSTLQRWDRRAAASADEYVALSSVVVDRIAAHYGRSASVLPPPPSLQPDGPVERPAIPDGPFFLSVSRLLPYKNIDALLLAFASAPSLRLVVAGTGPDAARLARAAPANVQLVGYVSDRELRWLYEHCTALVSASIEDYGLTPIEAASFGRPAVVLRRGGFLDTVIEDETGVFFDAPSPEQIGRALHRAAEEDWDVELIAKQAQVFSEARFIERLRALVLGESEGQSDGPIETPIDGPIGVSIDGERG
jgi:glycosyltransferase involved in cell wall biosynthesis